MALVLDKKFYSDYEHYFGDMVEDLIYKSIEKVFIDKDHDMVTTTINMIKTSMVIDNTYTNCHKKISSNITKILLPPKEHLDFYILSAVLRILHESGDERVEPLLFKSRDINKEVAGKLFNVPEKDVTKEMIDATFKSSDAFTEQSYSIKDEPVSNWDEYFYNVCRQVARNSKCLSRRIGAVMVKDKSIISTGYNGPPRGVPNCDVRWKIDKDFRNKYIGKTENRTLEGVCPRHAIGFKSGEGLDICLAGHAERNALINAARNGIKTKNTTLYMTCGVPCSPCLIEIINAGVKEIVVTSLNMYDESGMYLLTQSDLKIRLFNFIKN